MISEDNEQPIDSMRFKIYSHNPAVSSDYIVCLKEAQADKLGAPVLITYSASANHVE